MNRRIQFFSEDIAFTLKKKQKLREWITDVIRNENRRPWYINFIFCSDNYLLDLNKTFLKHTTLTDVITFPYEEKQDTVSGDIFISVERVAENALKFGEKFEDELHRVMVHGVLHLLGYEDKSPAMKEKMTSIENFYLARTATL